ncbi:aspartate aminotransferase family protein [Planococcus lenghuensis]|uniref:Aspartate aminotransferase family protein n=1 Tax=Planococcus lenghuensis TaxID=2213202 RepID=A0A1Q2KX10_9BACL|nr:aspartate aminotransferase family protein [Planococcus lenghuensis]AQQ52357.1 aspartate aminotransferase family protein [Planococcus lenghuensis]
MERSLLIKPKMDDEYPTAVRGEGVYIYDAAGHKYLDGSSGAVTALLGHAVPEIIDAMYNQSKSISFTYRSQFTTDAAEQLAQKLNELVGSDTDYWSFFVDSGSEATETAMKIAIQHWQEQGNYRKNKVLSRWNSYHGITLGALSMSGHLERRKRFAPLLDELPSISPPDAGLAGAEELDQAIRRKGADNVAAFIAEPIVGAAGGVLIPPAGYYERIREICDHHQVLFIADEVMTGIGRTGRMFGMDHWGAEPDIITLGKGMGAGYTPIAAALVSARVMEPILKGTQSVMSGHTYSANPQSAATAVAVLAYIEKHGLVERSAMSGLYLLDKFKALGAYCPLIGEVRGKGLMIGIDLTADSAVNRPFPKEMGVTAAFVKKARDNGLLVYPAAGASGGDGDTVIVAPPLTINQEEMDELVRLFKKTAAELQQEYSINAVTALD